MRAYVNCVAAFCSTTMLKENCSGSLSSIYSSFAMSAFPVGYKFIIIKRALCVYIYSAGMRNWCCTKAFRSFSFPSRVLLICSFHSILTLLCLLLLLVLRYSFVDFTHFLMNSVVWLIHLDRMLCNVQPSNRVNRLFRCLALFKNKKLTGS